MTTELTRSTIRVLTLGVTTCLRPALAAVAIADALAGEATAIAVSTANSPRLSDIARIVDQTAGRSAPLLTGFGLPATEGFDLVIALDDLAANLARPGRDMSIGRATPDGLVAGGGYLLCWPGPEPELESEAARATLDELRNRAHGLVTCGLLALIHARRQRRTEPVEPAAAEQIEVPVFHGLVGASVPMQLLIKAIRKTAKVDVSTLIQGETGSGKELVARAIHAESVRHHKPFLALNCAALPQEMAESELFGHRRGAFTGAVDHRSGRFRAADGGILFLDEVGDLPLALQAKLLRVLESREVTAVGTDTAVAVDVRVIAATHKDLQAGVHEGWFREDLYYRLAVAMVVVPPLRNRVEDLPLIAEHVLAGIRHVTQRPYEPIASATLEAWAHLAWPGNVRQLQNVVIRAAVHASGLQLPMSQLIPADPADARTQSPSALTAPLRPRSPNFGRRTLDMQRVRAALRQCGGNRVQAARMLGVARATLYRFLNEHPSALT